ncbi:MAG: phage tail tip lysozyme [Pseudomonadota bacterium]|nr:phage tail tip lysozyme [Pseudomonadota bacterium]
MTDQDSSAPPRPGPDIAAPLEHMGDVTQAVVPPAITGAEITRLGMVKADALRELAQGQASLGEGISNAFASIAAGQSNDMARRQQGDLAGRSQVGRDANGKITVQPSTSSLFDGGIFGGGGAYAHAVSNGLQTELTTQLNTDLQGIAIKHPGDPAGMQTEFNGYLAGHQQGALGQSDAGKEAILNARDYSQQLYTRSLTQKGASDILNARTALDGSIKQDQQDLTALALGGQAGGDAFNKTLAHQNAQYDAITSNPAFGISPESLAANRHGDFLNVQAATVQGGMATAFNKGGLNAAARVPDAINDRTDLTDADKAQLNASASVYWKQLQGANSAAIANNQTGFDSTLEISRNTGIQPPLETLQEYQREAIKNGDPDVASRAAQEIAAHHYAAATSALSPSQHDSINGVGQPAPFAPPAPGAPTSGAAVPPPPSGPTRQAASFNYLISKGWSQNAAHAMVATLSGESGKGLNTGVYQGEGGYGPAGTDWGKLGSASAAETAGGIANWNGARAVAFRDWAVSNGKDPNSFNAQIEYVDKEARQYGVPVTSTASPAALTVQFTGQFERPAVNNGSQRWANYAKGGVAGGAAPPSSNIASNVPGATITWQDIRDNPAAGASYARSIAADSNTRTQVAGTLIDSSTRALQNGVLPDAGTRTQIEQLATPEAMTASPALAGKYDTYSGMIAAHSLSEQSVQGGGQPLIEQARAAAVDQPDILQRQIVDKAQSLRDAAEKQLANDPVAASINGKWISRAPVPLDPRQPDSIPLHFRDNAGVVDAITAREPDFSKSVVFPNETGRFGAAMAGPATTVDAILQSIGGLPQDKRGATLQMPEVRAAILGAANSPDPVKKQVAFSFMDQVYRDDPQSFDGKFGAGGLRQLRAWQDVDQFKTPEMIAKDAATANDPSAIRARKSLADDADTKLKGVTPADITYKMAPHWGWKDYSPISDVPAQTNAVMVDDYSRAYTAQYSGTGDANAAEKYATERTALKWGPSDANGGRVMAFPPEKSPAYPMVNGSRSYIGTQLDQFVTKAGHAGAEAHLVPDASTEAEMSTGKPPGYTVVAQGDDGRFVALPGRFYADPAAAKTQAEAAFSARDTSRSGWRPAIAGSP